MASNPDGSRAAGGINTGDESVPGGRSADAVLVARLLQRDEAAFSDLVGLYQGRLLRLALTFVGSHAVAEEVVQDTWMAVLSGLDRFEGRSSLKTWIFTILCNQARTRAVRERRSVPFRAPPAASGARAPECSGAELR
jgi:RNA polymerase sigma-70 factor (ECF subfamily)